jgi:hypothetical protein
MPAQEPKKHHYLPEFYTRAWCGPNGRLIRYVKRRGTVHTREFTPGGVGYRYDLYRLLSETIKDRTTIERHHFERIDNAAAPVFDRMNREARPNLSREDRIAVTEFILALPARNPWMMKRNTETARRVYGATLSDPEGAKAIGLPTHRTIWTEIIRQNPYFIADTTLLHAVEASTNPTLIARVVDMHWKVHDVTGSPFEIIFGDLPFRMRGNLMIEDQANLIAIPVGPLRFMTCSVVPVRAPEPREMASLINREQVTGAPEHIFARDRSHIGLARKYLREHGTWTLHGGSRSKCNSRLDVGRRMDWVR